MYRYSKPQPTLKERLSDFALYALIYIRGFGPAILVGLGVIIVLGLIGWGLYSLAAASSIVKMATALTSLIFIVLFGRTVSWIGEKKVETNKVVHFVISLVTVFAIVISAYSIFLSVFLLPWFIIAVYVLYIGTDTLQLILKTKGRVVPQVLPFINKVMYWSIVAYIAFTLAKLLGWL